MAIKIGINGFGRIGKLVARAALEDGGFEIAGINDLMSPAQVAHAMKFDSVQGMFKGDIEAKDKAVVINGKEIPVTAIKDPSEIPWKEYGVDAVLESTGIFRTSDKVQKHIDAGAPKVLLSVPPKDDGIKLIVLGVNEETLSSDDKMVSNASCTTNSLAPIVKVLHENFGLQQGLMTTIHSSTNDQKVCDQVHSDFRRARSSLINIIPTTTGAAKAVGKVMPELNGLLNGMAVRTPTPTGSFTDLVSTLDKPASADEINAKMKEAAEGSLKGILEYTEDPLVSSDIIHNPASSIFDADSTMTVGKNLVKTCTWYDNEWGYVNRCIDLFKKMVG